MIISQFVVTPIDLSVQKVEEKDQKVKHTLEDTDVENTIESTNGNDQSKNNVSEIKQEENAEQQATVPSGENWRVTTEGTLEIFGGLVIGTDLDGQTSSWENYKDQIVKIVFTEPTEIRSQTNVFNQYPNLVEIDGLEFCNINGLTDLSDMFSGDFKLETLNLSNFDTSNVTNMSRMFSDCARLTELNLTSFNTNNVTDMDAMFSGCTSLTNVDLSNASSQKLTLEGSNNLFGIPDSPKSVAPIMNLSLNEKFELTENMQLRLWSEDIQWLDQNNIKLATTKDLVDYHNDQAITNSYRIDSSLSLTFETNGGTTIASQEIVAGEKWTEPEHPTKTGFVFAGWYSDKELTTRFDFGKEVTSSEVAYAKWEQVTIEVNTINIPAGTRQNLIQKNEFIKSIKIGDHMLSPNDYTVELENTVDTSLMKTVSTALKITLINDEWNQILSTTAQAKIIYGSTILTNSAANNKPDVASSLLNAGDRPYLVATQATGLSTYPGLVSRPSMNVYRGDLAHRVLNVSYQTVGNKPLALLGIWNERFDKAVLEYGDVAEYTVFNFAVGNKNENGNNTWISRDEKLTREARGYPKAYYELTKDEGYRLLQVNQLQVKNGVRVPLGISLEEMNQRINEFITIPANIINPEKLSFRFKDIGNTNTSGSSKKAIIEVSEKLASGGTFSLDYDVTYTINPVVTEKFVDDSQNELKESINTEFELNGSYDPKPENYLTIEGVLYRYVGWKTSMNDELKPDKPEGTTKETTYIYVYEQADGLIQVTMPTVMAFGTYDKTEEIQSKPFELINHSKKINTEIILDQFEENDSDVYFLTEEEVDPSDEDAAARLNLSVDKKVQISSLSQQTESQSLSKLSPEEKLTLNFSGTYFGDFNRSYRSSCTLKLRFRALEGA